MGGIIPLSCVEGTNLSVPVRAGGTRSVVIQYKNDLDLASISTCTRFSSRRSPPNGVGLSGYHVIQISRSGEQSLLITTNTGSRRCWRLFSEVR